MKAFLTPLQGLAEFEQIKEKSKTNKGILQVSGCMESQKSHLMYGLSGIAPYRLILAEDERRAREIYEDYRFYDRKVYSYPAKDLLFFQADIHGNLLIRQRMKVIKALLEEKELTVVTSIDGCMDFLESLEKIKEILEDRNDEDSLTKIKTVIDAFFQKKEETMLSDLLPAQAIQIGVECSDWKEAIKASAQYLIKKGAINEHYVDAMIQNVMENGPYIVVAPGFALPHEALNAGASKVGMSLIRLKTPVPFGKEEMDPIEWVCCLSAINKETHLKAMFQLVNLFYNQSFRVKIKECKTGEEIYKIIEQFEYETR